MKPRTLLALLVLTLGLGGFILFFEKDLLSTDERRALERKVLRLEVADIEGLVIDGAGGRLRLERREDLSAGGSEAVDPEDPTRPVTWYLSEPFEARADGIAVADLLKDLVGLESGQRLDQLDAAQSGLEEPVVEVTLQTSGDDVTLHFGAEVPASDDRIVAIVGEPGGHVAPASVVFDLQRPANDWRDKALINGLRSEVRKVQFATADWQVSLQDRNGDFWLTAPLEDRANRDHVSSLLAAVLGLRAESFVEGESMKAIEMGLDPPKSRLEVTFEGRDEAVEILLGGPAVGTTFGAEDLRYAKVGGELVTLKSGALDTLAALEVEDWQSTAWSRFEVFQVERAEVSTSAGLSMVLAREGSDWTRDGAVIDYGAASDLLYGLLESRAQQVIDRQRAEELGFSLATPAVTVRLSTVDDSEQLTLLDGVDGRHGALAEGREVVLILADDAVTELHRLIEAAASAVAPEPVPQTLESTAGADADNDAV